VNANPSIPLGDITDVHVEPPKTSTGQVTVAGQPAEPPGRGLGQPQQDGLAVMLASAEAIATCGRHEQRRLRALVAQDTATPRQIVPFLARLEHLAIHGAQLTRELQWLCQDMQRDGLAHTRPPTRHPEHHRV
jgi:hypothetical protein